MNAKQSIPNINSYIHQRKFCKRQEENWIERYSRKLKNGEHLVNLCESENLETHVKFAVIRAKTLLSC